MSIFTLASKKQVPISGRLKHSQLADNTQPRLIDLLSYANPYPQGPKLIPENEPLQIQVSYEASRANFDFCLLADLGKAKPCQTIDSQNPELNRAYESMIMGLVRVLTLRDGDTGEHTLRITELTVKIARLINMTEEELLHIRWGAMLHDIGKVAIPDQILLKPGPLTEDEWKIMQMHPYYAYQIFSPIPYLRLTMEIPFCHHEKWDGSGYPRGLIGEQIPLAARIFSVVDVWDALTSDRPYRPAWSEMDALHYIRENSGSHFDPKIVDLFFDNYETICLHS